MSNSGRSFHKSATWVADTDIFIPCGRQQNTKYTALLRFTQQNELTLVIFNCTNSTVTTVIDFVRSYIVHASNRPEEHIEKADTSLAGVTVEANSFQNLIDVIDGFDLTADLTA